MGMTLLKSDISGHIFSIWMLDILSGSSSAPLPGLVLDTSTVNVTSHSRFLSQLALLHISSCHIRRILKERRPRK